MSDLLTKLRTATDLATLASEDLEALNARVLWRRQARPNQLKPQSGAKDWRIWLCKAGRGWGKTRTEVEWAWWQLFSDPGSIMHAVARTDGDLKKTLFEGRSGFFNVVPKGIVARSLKSPYELHLTNGSKVLGFSAESPSALRGPEAEYGLCDEFAFWKFREETWDNLNLGLRLPSKNGRVAPRIIMGTTPLPVPELKFLLAQSAAGIDVALSEGATYDNTALDKGTLDFFTRRYGGTRLGRQELYGDVLDEITGALWTWAIIEKCQRSTEVPDPSRRVVAIDPAVTNNEESDETGIIVAQRDLREHMGGVLHDGSMQGTPVEWGTEAVELYDRYMCDAIVAEVNNGGDMVEHVIRTCAESLYQRGLRKSKEVRYIKVHASRGKAIRAEPIAALYEQNRIGHFGDLGELEKQLCTWSPLSGSKSPDRLDALVWALTHVMLDVKGRPIPKLDSTFGSTSSPWRVS